jgi:ankyrin repeat and fibronectin type-III domain-containing protein 1
MLNSRWVPLNKLQKKVSVLLEDSTINEILLSGIPEQINYYQMSTQKLSRGLYLGYLKLHSSFDTIQVIVPTKTPNNLPHVKIRENPHISAEEWNIIKSKDSSDIKIPLCFENCTKRTEAQEIFLESLKLSVIRLFKYLNVSSEAAMFHRLYDVEVIELNPDISFLIICPSAENAIPCAVPGQSDLILKRSDLMCLPLIVHEMIHLRTYQPSIIHKYARLSCIIEFDMMVANHKHREAFSSNEVQVTKERLGKLQDLMNSLNTVWKSVRWLMDVITYARSKEKSPELDMKQILEFNMVIRTIPTSVSSHLLELPTKDGRIKSPTRGSWPGPVQNNNQLVTNSFLSAEHSKSEQQLPNEQSFMDSGRLSVASCINSSRKNSGDSNYYSSGEIIPLRQMLPPSKSVETLFAIKKKGPSNLHHRKRSTTASITPPNHIDDKNTHQSINVDSLNVNVQNEFTADRSITTPTLLVSPSSSIFSTRLIKKNSKHLLEPTDLSNFLE